MKFCTRCGHANGDNNAFCEACGAPLRAKASVYAAVTPLAAAGKKLPTRVIAASAVVAVALLATGVAAYVLLMPPAASSAAFAVAAQQYLDHHPELAREYTCLHNFRYDQNPVAVVATDVQSRRWFDMLVDAGLYQAPQPRTSAGWFPQNQLLYQPTDAGTKAIRDGRLCFADGLSVKRIAGFTPPHDVGGRRESQVEVVLAYRNPAAWTATPTARQLAPDRFKGDPSYRWRMQTSDGEWVVQEMSQQEATLHGRRHVAEDQAQAAAAEKAGTAAPQSWWQRLKELFSAAAPGGNPLIGTWETSMMGLLTMQYEFTPNAMRAGDAVITRVRYELRDGEVVVYPEGQSVGLIVKVVDHDTIELNAGLATMTFKRVR